MRIPTCLAITMLGAAMIAAGAPAQRHPHFDDGGTLVWHTKLEAAKAAAKKAEKLILVEYGRQA